MPDLENKQNCSEIQRDVITDEVSDSTLTARQEVLLNGLRIASQRGDATIRVNRAAEELFVMLGRVKEPNYSMDEHEE